MIRQLAKATSRQRQVLRRSPNNFRTQLACLSTAPKPQLSISYEQWAAQNLSGRATTKREPAPAQPNINIRRAKPSKYKSLVHLPSSTTLQFPKDDQSTNTNANFHLNCLDFAIAEPGTGGHVVLGRNGSGKSLLVQQLQLASNNNNHEDWKVPPPNQMEYVSFNSHLQVLQDHPHRTVHDSITGGTGNLTKAAQYLVVRFGLYPILNRTLSTLSTGEIRKALLVSALAKQPRLLVLENAFDGLDAASRTELKTIVSKTIQGLSESGKLLVQQVNAEYVPPAQVLMSTHRPEEIVPEISTVSYVDDAKNALLTMPRPSDHSQEQLMYKALGLDKNHNKNTQNWSVVAPWEDNSDPTLPSVQDIQQLWSSSEEATTTTMSQPLLSLDQVQIRRPRDGPADDKADDSDSEFATLLHPLTWDIQQGQRWLIAGGNGAGKSTLSRFLLEHKAEEDDSITSSMTQDISSGVYHKQEDTTIGWVSTESHLGQQMDATAWDIIGHNGTVPESEVETMIQWVFGEEEASTISKLKERSLRQLSQGEQKLVLIASALAKQPKLLILDEPTQGLDWVHRRRVLALLERLCQANPELSLAFITHYEEEWIPSISHVLHLDKGQVLYQGERKEYNPRKL